MVEGDPVNQALAFSAFRNENSFANHVAIGPSGAETVEILSSTGSDAANFLSVAILRLLKNDFDIHNSYRLRADHCVGAAQVVEPARQSGFCRAGLERIGAC
jgi:hypothetical protein